MQSHRVRAWLTVICTLKLINRKAGKCEAILVTSVAVITVKALSAHPLGSLRCLGRLLRISLVTGILSLENE